LRVIEFTESQLSEKQLMTLLNEEEGFIQPYVSFQLATIKFEQKDFRRAREYYQDTVSMLPNSRLAEIAKERIEQIEARRKVSPQTIGAVLPFQVVIPMWPIAHFGACSWALAFTVKIDRISS
jgi:hypothetical protein